MEELWGHICLNFFIRWFHSLERAEVKTINTILGGGFQVFEAGFWGCVFFSCHLRLLDILEKNNQLSVFATNKPSDTETRGCHICLGLNCVKSAAIFLIYTQRG